MKIVRWVVLGYLGLAVWGLAREQRGDIECNCYEDCWCKRPGLSLFRWVFPIGHHLRDSAEL